MSLTDAEAVGSLRTETLGWPMLVVIFDNGASPVCVRAARGTACGELDEEQRDPVGYDEGQTAIDRQRKQRLCRTVRAARREVRVEGVQQVAGVALDGIGGAVA